MRMDGSVRSGVLKKKSSSGCLIIKKKGDGKNPGGGLGGLSSNSSEKKRPRLVASDSGSSDEDESLEFMRRRVNDKRLQNGSMGYNRSELENQEYHRNNVRMENNGEKKRNRLDLFDFDEYDEFDGKKMRNNEYVEDRFKMAGHKGGGNLKEFGLGSSSRNLVVDKRKHDPSLHGSGSGMSKGIEYGGGRSKGVEYGGLRSKGLDLEEDEAHMPISLLRLKYQGIASEPIRLQGKNGVLKVMVNKKTKTDMPSQHKSYDPREVEEGKGSRSENAISKDVLGRSPVYPPSKPSKNLNLFVDKERSNQNEKRESKLEKVKPSLSKTNKARELEVDGTDTALKLAPPGPQASISKKGVKKEEEKSPSPENITPVKGKDVKEGKAKRGGSTEKQMLREKIRGMLVDAGWSIDYRPRRNRDYLDAVYINPSGTAYWSIIKAYDAFKKQLEEDNDKSKLDIVSPSFAPLSDAMIHKLTRQTKKKTEEEMRRKRKEDGSSKSAKRSAGRETAESSDSDQNEERLGSYGKQSYNSQRRKLHDGDQESEDDLSDDSRKRKPRKVRGEKPPTASNSNVSQGRTSKVIGRCTLLVRGSDKGGNSESDGYVSYCGKRTVLAWLIDSGTAQLSEKVQYMNRKRTRVMLEGWITREGIHCGCCSKILTVSKFELHAGSKLRQPFQNIFLESGASLLQCQLDAWNTQEESVRRDFHTVDVDGDDPDDDTCGLCGDGGDLICCDSCPSTFHQVCLGIQMLPPGDWHCPNCTCKFCGNADVPEANDSAPDELIRCIFCEKKYHQSCSKQNCALSTASSDSSFCGLKCQELYDHLQKNLGVKHELEAGFSWSLIQRMDVSDTSHRGFPQRVECNSKLAVALTVMDECFLPIIDRRSGIDIIRNVVYNCGSNFNRLNYCGFYTMILERGDEIISAASIRIHGTRLAEMPFIGTREIYRRQGMCRRLLTAIETELSSLKVGQLIIPAISEHMNTWTRNFGFHQLEDVVKKEIKSMNMLVFPGTDMLQKQLMKQEIADGQKVSESIKNSKELPVSLEKSDVDSSMEQNRQVSDDSGVCHETKSNDEVNDPKPCSSAIPSDGKTVAIASKFGCQSEVLVASKENSSVDPELENKQKEPLASPSTPVESNKITEMENGSLDPPANENTNSSTEAAVGNTCENETPSLKSICDTSSKTLNEAHTSGNQKALDMESADVQDMVAKDAAPQMTINSVSGESQPGLVFETSAESDINKDQEEHIASFLTAVVNGGEPLAQLKPDSTPSNDPKVAIAGGNADSATSNVNINEICDGPAPCTKENVEKLAFDSSLEDSARDAVVTINENQTPASNDELDHQAVEQVQNELNVPVVVEEGVDRDEKIDNHHEKFEMCGVAGEKVASIIPCYEDSMQKAAITENHTELSNSVDRNSE